MSTLTVAEQCYRRSVARAESDGLPEWLEGSDGWWLSGNRGQAIAFFASEHGHAFTEVRARREYMRIDHDAIRDLVDDLAAQGREMPEIAYTYEDEGWMWEHCAKDDERGVALWYCEVKP